VSGEAVLKQCGVNRNQNIYAELPGPSKAGSQRPHSTCMEQHHTPVRIVYAM